MSQEIILFCYLMLGVYIIVTALGASVIGAIFDTVVKPSSVL